MCPKPLFKTTVVIWSEYDGTRLDMAMLGREAAAGDAYCSRFRSELISEPATDEAWDGTEFFGVDDEPDEDLCSRCQEDEHETCGDGPASRPYNADCRCCSDKVASLAGQR